MNEEDLKKKVEEEIDNLVIKSQSGDVEAFSRLYDLLIDQIYRYIYFRVSSEDTEDLTEMVFLKVWENIKTYKKDQFSFLAWVYRIAHNLVVDHYRIHRSIAELDTNLQEDRKERDPKYVLENKLNNKILKKAISKLKENYQQILILKFINDLSNDEIAAAMKRRRGSIRILQFRALAGLKKVLLNMGVYEP